MIINTNFNIGDIVWFLHEGKIKQGKIKEISIKVNHNVDSRNFIVEYYNNGLYVPVVLEYDEMFGSCQSLCSTMSLNALFYIEHYDNFYDIALNHPEIEDFYSYQDENNENLDLEATIDAINSSDELKIRIKKEDDRFTVIFK